MFHYSEKGMLQCNCKLDHLPSSLDFHCRGFPLSLLTASSLLTNSSLSQNRIARETLVLKKLFYTEFPALF